MIDLSSMFNWLKESNRLTHFKWGFILAFFGTFLTCNGAAFGVEYGEHIVGDGEIEFDWLDIAATDLGGVLGQICQIVVILLFKGLF